MTDWASRVTTYSYDAVGRLTQLLRPNGTKQTRTYDVAGQLTQLREFAPDGSTALYAGDHSYDLAGQLTGETLTPAITPLGANVLQTFDRDNRLLTHNGAATTFDADGNLLSVASGVSPASYTYDARNRLTSAGGLSYTYDAENRRVALTDASGTTRYAVNPNATLDQVLVRTAPDGTKTFYVYGLGLLHEETGSTVRYYHHARRGDTIALTDGAGAVTDRASYGAYGELLSRTGTTNTPFLYCGFYGVQTDSNGIYYHRARYYHPQLKRFLNQDTVIGSISIPTSLNRFAYVNGQPISGIDPLGLYLSPIHYAASFLASISSGYSVFQSHRIAVASVKVDFIGNQGKDAASTAVHGMTGIDPMTGLTESRCKAAANHEDYIKLQLRLAALARENPGLSNSAGVLLESLGFALHAVQDPRAPGHADFQEWHGLSDLPAFVRHIVGDLYVSPRDFMVLVGVSQHTLKEFQQNRSGGR